MTTSQLANSTTPPDINVPNTPTALFVWAIGQYGPTVAYLTITLYMLQIVYTDMKASNDKMTAAFMQQIESSRQTSQAINALTDEIRKRN